MSSTKVRLALSGRQYEVMRTHLFPADGMEAIMFLLCGFADAARRTQLVVRRLVAVPHDALGHRSPTSVTWSVERFLLPLADEIERLGLAVVIVHSHPNGPAEFSATDDEGDRELLPAIHLWSDRAVRHGTAIMTRDGRLVGRTVGEDGSFSAIDLIAIAGDDIHLFWAAVAPQPVSAHAVRTVQTFGQGTYELLRRLRIGVVGCSGTGSIVVELLARCSVGVLVLVDPDRLEGKNLNRILNGTQAGAEVGEYKVSVLARAVASFGTGTEVEAYPTDVFDPTARLALSECDVLFGCVDTVEGRHVLNRLASAFAIPYFDVGVAIEVDGGGGIEQAVADAHYLQPGGSSLMSRGVYDGNMLHAESIKRQDPAQYADLHKSGYLAAVAEDRPAVMPLNMMAANMAVLDLLARIHGYRLDANDQFARQRHDLVHGHYERFEDGDPCLLLLRDIGMARWDNIGC